jgi:hypothetical protein
MKGFGQMFENRRRLHQKELAVTQSRHLAITVFYQVIGLLVLAFPQIDVNVGKGMAAQG